MSAYETIVAALEDHGMRTYVRSDSTRAQCPVHQSRGLTLSVRRMPDRASVLCFAGCDDTDVLSAIRLGVRDLFDEPRSTSTTPTSMYSRPEPTAWEAAMAELGIRNPPSLDHVLNRMVVEAMKEGRL